MGRSNLGIAQSDLAWSKLGIKQDGGDNDEDGFEQEKKGRKREQSTYRRVEGKRTTI